MPGMEVAFCPSPALQGSRRQDVWYPEEDSTLAGLSAKYPLGTAAGKAPAFSFHASSKTQKQASMWLMSQLATSVCLT